MAIYAVLGLLISPITIPLLIMHRLCGLLLFTPLVSESRTHAPQFENSTLISSPPLLPIMRTLCGLMPSLPQGRVPTSCF